MWGSLEHADAFGRLVQRRLDPAPLCVLEVQFEPAAHVCCYNQRQDGIGPAYFADEDALKLVAGIREVKALQRYEPEQNG